MSIFLHEQLYRTNSVMAKLKEFPITICDAGALGANLAENLARARRIRLHYLKKVD